MNLYRRTFGLLKPYWKQLVTASLSASLHAIFAGALVWLAGPLLMTLFQVDAPGSAYQTGSGQQVVSEAPAQSPVQLPEAVTSGIESLRERMKGAVNALVVRPDREETLWRFCWLILAVVLAKNFFMYMQGFFMAYVQQSIIRILRDQLFAKYQQLSLAWFQRRRTGHVISRVTNDVVVLNESVDLSFNHLVTDTIQVILFASFLVILSWKMTLLAMIVMPVVFGFIWFLGRKLRKYSSRAQERMADVNSVLEENISNARIVKAFATEKFENRKFFATTREFFRSLLRMTRIRHLSSPINDTLISVAGLVILVFAGSRIITGTGELDAGDFMTFVIAMFSLVKPVKSLSQIHIRIQEGLAASERIFNVLDSPPSVVEAASPRTISGFRTAVEYRNITFTYPGSVEPVLRNVGFRIDKGQIVALVGPSGAGKSTLLDLLPRFYDPDQGSITIDGIDIRDLSLRSLRGLMGIVTQETLLFNDTVANNIAYGLDDVPAERIEKAARMANAHRFIVEFDDGYETVIGSRGVRLSGGQRQRLAIARALLRDPDILIFDEATSALDTESELLVQEAIGRLMANRTTLVVAHRLSTITNADHIIVLDDGRIVEQGRHEELVRHDGLYRRLYDMQFKNGAAAGGPEAQVQKIGPEGKK